MSKKLTIKQKKFADEYIISGNASEAAIKAGYKESSARSIGNENLTKPDIKSYIDERMKELDDKKIAEQKEVLAFYTSVMRGEVREPMAISNGMGEDIKMVIPSAATRKSAADSLAKAHGMFIQKLEIEAETVVIKDDIDE
ncbi:terminase small subunit [Ezakiella peruensis]|uniref:terminase small subunit n=1 Tax=Ezakiella peruensis TaxID=1464038 RepID=UPI000C1B59EB|nr:terminase small subunit [Ezakiella peruensis]